MKKLIGLGLLAVTGMTAFAAPAAANERYDRGRKEVIVVRHHKRVRRHPVVRMERDWRR